MAKIRKSNLFDTKSTKQLFEYIDFDFSQTNSATRLNFFPLNFINELLPLDIKFLQDNYVVIDEGKILGKIGLLPDNNENKRWKINTLQLEHSSVDISKQLIDYVINKYGAIGVETFITSINHNQPETISLFKNHCGFRNCSNVEIWKKSNLCFSALEKALPIRQVSASDIEKLLEFDTQSIFPQFRISMIKTKSDFKTTKNQTSFVLCNNKEIEGFISLKTINNIDFYADINVSLPYQEYFNDIITHLSNIVCEKSTNRTLYIKVKKHYQTSAKLNEKLEQYGFEKEKSMQVLVKDYWTPIEAVNAIKKSSIGIFSDSRSPACNFAQDDL